MDSQKNTIRDKHWRHFRHNLIPNNLSKALAKAQFTPNRGNCEQKELEIQPELPTTKSEQMPLASGSTMPPARSPSNYNENLKRQQMSACLEASIWHLQQRPDPQIQPLKTALNQSLTPARLSCSAPCQQNSPS